MNNDEFLDLAIKILGNEASKDEYEVFRKCVENKDYYKKFVEISKHWKESASLIDNLEFDPNKGYDEFLTRISGTHHKNLKPEKNTPIFHLFHNSTFVRAAASIAFVFFLSAMLLYLFGVFNSESNSVAYREKITRPGEISTLTFLDGTKIILNADSKLKYPSVFQNNLREVFLEGEAYFEVAHTDNIPFIVHSEDLSTTVLGTKFNVKAFPEEKDIFVSLVEGKVKVSIAHNGETLLNPEEQLSFNKASRTEEVSGFNLLQVVGWKDNILIFDDVTLEKALVVLERLYDVKFELADTSFGKMTIKANFENASFWTIVKVIKSLTALEYKTEIKNSELQKIIFYKK